MWLSKMSKIKLLRLTIVIFEYTKVCLIILQVKLIGRKSCLMDLVLLDSLQTPKKTNIRDNGFKGSFMERAWWSGKMELNMMAIMWMEWNREKVSLYFAQRVIIKDIGKMESRMGWGLFMIKMAKKKRKECG